MTIQWSEIREPYMRGIRATVGDRTAEVVQAYEGQWCAFLRIGGQMCKRMASEPEYLPYAESKKLAAQFLRGELTPEVWPPKTQQ